MSMNTIITKGLGEYQQIVTQGFGGLAIVTVPPAERHIFRVCPYCEVPLRHNTYSIRDQYTGVRTVRCKICFNVLSPDDLMVERGKRGGF